MTNLPDELVAYFHAKEQERAARAERMFNSLSLREQGLVRDAAIMGFVRGSMAEPGLIPKDRAIIAEVLLCCDGHDLYPTLGTIP